MEAKKPSTRHWRLQDGERRILLVVGDLVAATVAAILALALWAQLDWLGFSIDFLRARAVWFVVLPLGWVLLMVNQYDLRRAASVRKTLRGVLLAAMAGVTIYLAVFFISDPGSLPRRGMLYFLGLAVLLTLTWRLLYIRVLSASAFKNRVVIVVAGHTH